MDLKLALDAHAIIAESPTWVAKENAVYWIDIKAPALHRLDLATWTDREWRVSSDIGAFALVQHTNQALVALREGLFLLDLATGDLVQTAKPPFDPERHRFNEGACDSSGRFWVGTMFDPVPGVACPAEPSSLHSFTLAGGLRPEPDAAELHNGMAWSPDETIFYLSHSEKQSVHAHPFDAQHGVIGQAQVFAAIPPDLGLPDGAAVDEEGGYWCALHGGSRLHRYRSDGTLDQTVMLPVSQPTMCAFVGPALDLMVVTTASDKLSRAQREAQPDAGGLFCFRPKIRGVPRRCYVA